jgi:hypothetical protein
MPMGLQPCGFAWVNAEGNGDINRCPSWSGVQGVVDCAHESRDVLLVPAECRFC